MPGKPNSKPSKKDCGSKGHGPNLIQGTHVTSDKLPRKGKR